MLASVQIHMAQVGARGKREGSSGGEANCSPNPWPLSLAKATQAGTACPSCIFVGPRDQVSSMESEQKWFTSFLGHGGEKAGGTFLPFSLQELNAKNFEAQGTVQPRNAGPFVPQSPTDQEY